jgi:hypothetical protein
MVRYRKFDPFAWRHAEFKSLTDKEKLAAIYSFTAQSNRCGIFCFSPALAAEDLGWTQAAFIRVFHRVVKVLRWRWDPAARVLYIPSWWKYNRPENVSHLIGCLKDLHEVPTSPLLDAFSTNGLTLDPGLRDVFEKEIRHILDTSGTPLPPRAAHSVPQQEQEQEQEQEQPPVPSRDGEAPPATPSFTTQDLKDLWNRHVIPPIQRSLGLAGQRLVHARARLKEHPEPEFWDGLIRRFAGSAFVRKGGSNGAWRPGIDYILRAENILKIAEGRFDDGAAAPERRRQTVDLDQHIRDVRALGERGNH